MSKTIEFVDEKIKMLNVAIESAVKIVKEFDGIVPVDSYKKLVEEHLKEIQTLEQIKCELEAWEVVKRELKLTLTEDKQKYDFVYYWLNYHPYELLEIEKKDYQKLKKALEVEDE